MVEGSSGFVVWRWWCRGVVSWCHLSVCLLSNCPSDPPSVPSVGENWMWRKIYQDPEKKRGKRSDMASSSLLDADGCNAAGECGSSVKSVSFGSDR